MRILSLARDYPKAHSSISAYEVIHAYLNPSDVGVDTSAIALPKGRFSIQSVLDRLPSGWQPDCIQISSSLGVFASPPAIPMGVNKLACPTVMKLTDSHFRHRPIQSLIEYAQTVGCQYHWTTYDRHHLHFFKEAGLPNPFWMPGAMSIQFSEVTAASEKVYDVLFCGSNSPQIHPRRATLLAFLQTAGVNVTVTRKPYLESLEAYTAAHIVFNCSLNGDLNRRVFETLMAGGFLMTDRLASESGLPLLFEEGVHLECYGSEQELLDKVEYYLAHPDQAAQIARQGHEHFMAHYHPLQLEERFLNFVVNGHSIPDVFLARDDDRTHTDVQSCKSESLRDRIRIYELIHDLHRVNHRLTMLVYQSNHSDTIADLRDLPRLHIVQADTRDELQHQTQKFEIALVECPQNQQQLEALLTTLQPHLCHQGIVVIAGRSIKKFQASIKAQGWLPIHLTESGEGVCLVYQNPDAKHSDGAQEHLNLPVTKPLNLPDRFVLKTKTVAKNVLSSIAPTLT
jgi:hypothetical protein